MPCHFEIHPIGQTNLAVWFCCNCTNGPLNIIIELHCSECSHKRCSSLQFGQTHRPPEFETERFQLLADASSRIPPRQYPYVTGEQYLGNGVSDHTLGFHRHSQHRTTPVSQHRPSSTIEDPVEALTHPQGGCNEVQVDPKRGRRASVKRKRSSNTTNIQLQLSKNEDQSDFLDANDKLDPGRVYACPFFVMNANRYRYSKFKGCCHAWTMPRLREHIIGRSRPEQSRHGPHVLHMCDQCFEGFLDEDTLAVHDRGAPCPSIQNYPLPAEGVGRILAEKICELPKGPKGEKRVQEYEAVWNRWYRVLSGRDAPPQSCYFKRAEILANDPKLLEDTKTQLVRTFQLALPIELKAEALRCYLECQRSVAFDAIEPLVDISEFKKACEIINSPNIEPNKRKPRFAKFETAKDEPVFESLLAPNNGTPVVLPIQQSSQQKRSTEIEKSVLNADASLHETLPTEHWTIWPGIEDPYDQCGGYNAFEKSLLSQNVPSDTEISSVLLPEWGDLPLPAWNDIGICDTLESVRPELLPHNLQPSLVKEKTETPAEDGEKKGIGGRAVRREIGQPINAHGVFEQTAFDPLSNPSFEINQPVSQGLLLEDALFDLGIPYGADEM